MLTAHVESFMACLPELAPVLPLHYQELALDQDKVPLDPDYSRYQMLEDAGALLFVALRQRGALVGYYIGFMLPHMHYASCMTCSTDIFYVLPELRLKGGGGVLFNAVEAELKRRKVQRWIVAFKCHLDAGGFFEQLDFVPIERVYSKWIGG